MVVIQKWFLTKFRKVAHSGKEFFGRAEERIERKIESLQPKISTNSDTSGSHLDSNYDLLPQKTDEINLGRNEGQTSRANILPENGSTETVSKVGIVLIRYSNPFFSSDAEKNENTGSVNQEGVPDVPNTNNHIESEVQHTLANINESTISSSIRRTALPTTNERDLSELLVQNSPGGILNGDEQGIVLRNFSDSNDRHNQNVFEQIEPEYNAQYATSQMSNTPSSLNRNSCRSMTTILSNNSDTSGVTLYSFLHHDEYLAEKVISTLLIRYFVLTNVFPVDAILPNIVGRETLDSVPGLTSKGYKHCCVTEHVQQLIQLLNGNQLEKLCRISNSLPFEYFKQGLKSRYMLPKKNYDRLQAHPTFDLLTSVHDNELFLEKLNNCILVHIAVVFESAMYCLASLSLTELKTIAFDVKNGTTSIGSAFRMNLVTSQVFEEAMRDCRVHTFQLTYSYVYPRNCRMLIGIPVYNDGYINGKDRKQNR